MVANDRGGGDSGAELAFERALIASAATDHVGEDAVRAAWSRFSVALGTTATLADAATPRPTWGAKLASSGRGTLGWLSLGALGGGLVTAGLLGVFGGRGAPVVRVPASVAPTATLVVEAAPAVSATARRETPSTLERAGAAPFDAERAAQESPGATPKRRGAQAHERGDAHDTALGALNRRAPARQQTAAETSLAAEIALLDDARRAGAAGEFDRALALLGRYQREHPHGELRRESDVLWLETLSLRGDRGEATRRARRFLDAFPDDPHVAHVRTFAR